MNDQTNGGNGPAASAPAQPAAGSAAPKQPPRLQVLTQYIRDLSFENIAAQKQLSSQAKPEIKVQVNLDAKKLADTQHEVILKVTLNSTVENQTVFVLELEYAGRFVIQNVPDNQLHPFLMIECPRLLFPFLRRIVADVTRDGGFPPINLDNIDFLSLYRNEIARRQAQAAQAQQAAKPVS